MVANPKNFQLMFLARNKSIEKEMLFVGKATKSSTTIENNCCKANNKMKGLFRIRSFLTPEQAKVLAEAYILSNFRYCPLVWMFCGKCSNNFIFMK